MRPVARATCWTWYPRAGGVPAWQLSTRGAEETLNTPHHGIRWHLVLPTFEHFALREISVSSVDRFLKAQAKVSCSRAKRAKTVLSLVLVLADRRSGHALCCGSGHREASGSVPGVDAGGDEP